MTGEAAALRQMLAGLAGSETKEADLLFLQLEPDVARLLELCAIPHTFDPVLVGVLDPSATAELIDAFIVEISLLPTVTALKDCFLLHDVIREQMFLRWLAPERRAIFSDASRRLAKHFASAHPQDSAQAEAYRPIIVFHGVGADFDRGFKAFQELYREYREASRYSACEVLVRMVGEYRSVMTSLQVAWLTYYEAESASDGRNPQRALALLQQLRQHQELPVDLAIRVLVHMSAALREMRQSHRAATSAREALDLTSSDKGRHLRYLARQELGLIARDQGEVEVAEYNLRKAARLALANGDCLSVARAYNSLGTVMQKIAPRKAIEFFQASVSNLLTADNNVRLAQVYNNLGTAYANVGDWENARSSYERSLEIKRAGADLHGQALTLLNMSRVYQTQRKDFAARNALTESATLFEATQNPASAAAARRELARIMWNSGSRNEAADEACAAVTLFQRANLSKSARGLEREFKRRFNRGRRLFLSIISIIVLGIIVSVILVHFFML